MEPELNHDIAEAPTEEEIEALKQEKGIEGPDYSEEIEGALSMKREYDSFSKQNVGDSE